MSDKSFSNQYGHFEDDGRRYVITNPKTPTPWVNVISNGRYGLVVSHNGGGFSWLDNSQLNVLTRWEMDLVRDRYGRFLYLSDLDDSTVWSLSPAPCFAPSAEHRCEHEAGATTFHTAHHGVRSEWTLAAATEAPVELWLVRVTNTTQRPRRLRIASFMEWCCGVAPDSKREFHRLFFTCEHDAALNAVIATKNMWDVPARSEREHWNRPWPYVAGHSMGGERLESPIVLCDKQRFLGRYGDTSSPAAMKPGHAGLVGPFGRFGDASAALGGDFSLAPGATATFYFLIGIGQTRGELTESLRTFSSVDTVEREIGRAKSSWIDRLSPTKVSTARGDLDLLCNHWLPYQAISGRLWGRTGYYQQSGAFGFRDQLQDSQVWLNLDPQRSRDQILLHARHQFADGSVYHWWHPLTETGLRTKCSDDYLWLAFITCQYLKETGDFSILSVNEPFVDQAAPATLLDHCERAIARTFSRLSARGIPLIGSCDWNDGLSSMGIEDRGESVWLGWFLCTILSDMERLYDRLGIDSKAAECSARRKTMIQALNTHAWDGAWYRYGTKDDGQWVGSTQSPEGRIHLNAQTWAILSDAAPADRAQQAWNSVKQHLLTDYGPLLLAPAYTVPDPTIGYITRYAPGTRENGGVYMHAATWALAAACQMKDAASAERIWNSVSPPVRGADAEAYFAEPYVVPGNVDGPLSDLPGRAGWTWYTGSAQWLRRVALEWVVGVRPTWDGLLVDPCAFASLGKVNLTRRYRGCAVTVRFDAAGFRPGTRPRVTVDGTEVEGGVVPTRMIDGKSSVAIEVTWPAEQVVVKAPASVSTGRKP
ncbi:MAG: hypothetical protein L6Q35_02475 [Phycisphaerales bacterium]|nr:hypothetical protein [Phycisphaerales bacterium]